MSSSARCNAGGSRSSTNSDSLATASHSKCWPWRGKRVPSALLDRLADMRARFKVVVVALAAVAACSSGPSDADRAFCEYLRDSVYGVEHRDFEAVLSTIEA